MMNNDSTIYIVKPESSQLLDEFHGTFDSLKKAKDFVKRFKTKQKDVEITTLVMNPSYHTDKNTDPYFVVLSKLSDTPLELFICNAIGMDEDFKNGSYSIFFNPVFGEDEGIFIFHCLAADKKEATSKTIAKRDSLISSGEWKITWESFNLKWLINLK